MYVVVPFAADAPKTRLGAVLTADERDDFARVMLMDVLTALDELDRDPDVEVLSTGPVDVDASVTVDDRPLSAAINDVLAARGEEPVAVVMADLALATPDALDGLLSTDGDVVLAPGRGGGTNALVVRNSEFQVDYHGVSVRDHRRAAAAVGATVAEVDSFRLSTDVDEPADLVEVLLHGTGQAREWLEAAGFELDVTDGRVDVTRRGRT